MNNLNKLDQISQDIIDLSAMLAREYKQANARGMDEPCSAPYIRLRINRLTRQYTDEAEKGVDINGR